VCSGAASALRYVTVNEAVTLDSRSVSAARSSSFFAGVFGLFSGFRTAGPAPNRCKLRVSGGNFDEFNDVTSAWLTVVEPAKMVVVVTEMVTVVVVTGRA